MGLESVSILHLFVWEGEKISLNLTWACMGGKRIGLNLTWACMGEGENHSPVLTWWALSQKGFPIHLYGRGRNQSPVLGFSGVDSESFPPFPHSFAWMPQKPHYSSTGRLWKPVLICDHLTIHYGWWSSPEMQKTEPFLVVHCENKCMDSFDDLSWERMRLRDFLQLKMFHFSDGMYSSPEQ